MKKIGVVARIAKVWDRSAIYMFDNIRRICFEHNCIPIMIIPPQTKDYYACSGSEIGHLNDEEIRDLKNVIDECDGLIIPGGSRWYDYDTVVYELALKRDIPILGICMGMQLMVSLDTNSKPIKMDNDNHYQKDTKYAHDVIIDKDSKLYEVF